MGMARRWTMLALLGGAAAALAGCGNTRELMPKRGHVLPAAPYGMGYKPDADELLKRGPQAAPQRNVELRRRSEEREDDPFDLPPTSR